MAKYDKETKFYWLQLKEDFFEDDAIEWLEEQKPNGRDYAYFYLKLCLKSLKTNGILIRQVGKVLIPYDNEKLAEITKTDYDTVVVAMELLKQIGLIEVFENGEIYITQLENLIGSVSKSALKKQQQRIRQNGDLQTLEWTEGGQMSTKDKDKDKDKDKKKEIDNNKLLSTKKDKFIPPTLEEVVAYCQERNKGVDGYKVYDYYSSNDWKDSKGSPIKNWKQKIIGVWEKEEKNTKQQVEEYNPYDLVQDEDGAFIFRGDYDRQRRA